MNIAFKEQSYIGDGVYLSYDGFNLWLKTHSNEIALEPYTFRGLLDKVEDSNLPEFKASIIQCANRMKEKDDNPSS